MTTWAAQLAAPMSASSSTTASPSWGIDCRTVVSGGSALADSGMCSARVLDLAAPMMREEKPARLVGGVVPPEAFTLAAGDLVRVVIEGIGTLENPVRVVGSDLRGRPGRNT